MSVETQVLRNPDNGVTIVSVGDGARLPGLPLVRALLRKCVVECPTGLLVDLAGIEALDGRAAGMFASVAQHAMRDYGVPVLLFGAANPVAEQLSPFRTFVTLHDSRYSALLALRSWVPRWLHARMPPVPTSAGGARHLIGDACLAWDLGRLRDPALLVVSELTDNAIEHAITDFEVTVAYNGRYLRIAVQDASEVLPHPLSQGGTASISTLTEQGRGLYVLAGTATWWGITPLSGGKIVWVLLRAD